MHVNVFVSLCICTCLQLFGGNEINKCVNELVWVHALACVGAMCLTYVIAWDLMFVRAHTDMFKMEQIH